MTLFAQAEAAFLIGLAAFLSMLIGMDRERKDVPAGMRTHMLVGMGSCLFTILSAHGLGEGDTRIAAGVVQGIGFIGAGTVLVRRGAVIGLTTAASVWVTASIGMAVGFGAWFLALAATVLVWFVLAILHRAENQLNEQDEKNDAPNT